MTTRSIARTLNPPWVDREATDLGMASACHTVGTQDGAFRSVGQGHATICWELDVRNASEHRATDLVRRFLAACQVRGHVVALRRLLTVAQAPWGREDDCDIWQGLEAN